MMTARPGGSSSARQHESLPARLFFPYRYDRLAAALLRPIGVRPSIDGVRIDRERLIATLGPFSVVTLLANIADASVDRRRYPKLTAIGPRLSLADHGLTFGTTNQGAVCLTFAIPIRRVVGPWDHPTLWITVADPDGLVQALGR